MSPDAPWMMTAACELGVCELPGPEDNPRIREYLRASGLDSGDETSWCSAFVNWVLLKSGYAVTGSPAARSWQQYGTALDTPRFGAVTVLWRGSPKSWTGHVGFFLRAEGEYVRLLGGNQYNQVCGAVYPAYRVVCYRWPVRSG